MCVCVTSGRPIMWDSLGKLVTFSLPVGLYSIFPGNDTFCVPQQRIVRASGLKVGVEEGEAPAAPQWPSPMSPPWSLLHAHRQQSLLVWGPGQ